MSYEFMMMLAAAPGAAASGSRPCAWGWWQRRQRWGGGRGALPRRIAAMAAGLRIDASESMRQQPSCCKCALS